jgi:teichuronic acid biosynthesis glycosyltransferase TuaH
MKPDFDIVMLALPRWDGQYSSTAYSLAQALSVYTRVFYIDNPFTLKDFITQRKSAQIRRRRKALLRGHDIFTTPISGNNNLVAVTPQLTLPINWLPAGLVYDTLSGLNDRIVYRAVSKLLQHFDVRRFVFINSFNPLFGRFFPARFRPLLTIYHSVDDISKSEYIAVHGTRLENEAVSKADFTIVTSMELKRLKEKHSRNVHYLPNAANVGLFQTAFSFHGSRPAELATVPESRKVILYMGNICHRLDYELLRRVALEHPGKTLVMVGPTSVDYFKKAGLDRMPNVIFTGSKKLEELPVYVAASSCCIIPFVCNQLTRSIYPLKINEYLSGGKPVVTTNFSEDILNFGEVAFVSETHDDFVNNIQLAIDTDSPQAAETRMQYAAGNNWDARATQLLETIEDYNTKRHGIR